MNLPAPHFLLHSRAYATANSPAESSWEFVLESPTGENRLEASDIEPGTSSERLELLAVLRGLEALDQPSHVTLVTSSRYVLHGLKQGLDQWRDDDWHWERYGKMEQIKNADLWRRLDQAIRIHQLDFRVPRTSHGDDLNAYVPPAETPTKRSSRRTVGGKRVRIDSAHSGAPRGRAVAAATSGWWDRAKTAVSRWLGGWKQAQSSGT